MLHIIYIIAIEFIIDINLSASITSCKTRLYKIENFNINV